MTSRPPSTAPVTVVIPPRYANATKASAADDPKVTGADGAEAVRLERARQIPAIAERDRERGQLDRADVHAGRGCGALVRANGEHPLSRAGCGESTPPASR